MRKTEDQLIAQYGERNVATVVVLAVQFGKALSLHPGHVMQLLADATPEELANVKTGRQALALVMKQYTKKVDESFARAEAATGSQGPDLDLSCVKDLYEAANGEEAVRERSPLYYVDGPTTLQ